MVGDIVIAPFPYSDLSSTKGRPILVVANVSNADWIVRQLTSRGQRRPGDIEITQQDMATGVLREDSWARPGYLHTLDQGRFSSAVGRLSNAKLAEILAAVRALF